MKAIITIFVLLTTTSFHAQTIFIWKGGTPGHETNWNEPRNWDKYHVPDASSHVIIPGHQTGHNAQPQINQRVEIASIEIHASGTLMVTSSGELFLHSFGPELNPIQLFGGKIKNKGKIRVEGQPVVDFSPGSNF